MVTVTEVVVIVHLQVGVSMLDTIDSKSLELHKDEQCLGMNKDTGINALSGGG